ncbi:MAG: transposase [Deltaproteobacteria bacterium]|nr:transposase [Deltaproteobacteria bacterium]
MAKPSRWSAEKRYQIVKEALSQKEPLGQIARRHQVSEGLIYRCGISSKAAKRR